ncbi:MAG: DUF1289 domain-containing protein [Deltaproteobacteria bacterium]
MPDPATVPTPCRGTCRLGADALCDGCGRTIREISEWIELTAEARRRVMDRVARWTPREPPARR